MNPPSTKTLKTPGTASVVLPVMNETWSLEETTRILADENQSCLEEILIVTSPLTTRESLQTIEHLLQTYPRLIRVHCQTLPYLGGAIQEAFALVRGHFTVLMASDLETDPHLVRLMLNEIEEGGYDVVIASRWLKKHSFYEYSPLKYTCNFLFQKIFSLLYHVSLTDLTYGFRVYRTDIVQHIIWEEFKHSFFLESLVKPLRMGYLIKEIPATWIARKEGVSKNTFFAYFGYFKIGLTVLFRDPYLFIKKSQ